jgi:hypothetical protein
MNSRYDQYFIVYVEPTLIATFLSPEKDYALTILCETQEDAQKICSRQGMLHYEVFQLPPNTANDFIAECLQQNVAVLADAHLDGTEIEGELITPFANYDTLDQYLNQDK